MTRWLVLASLVALFVAPATLHAEKPFTDESGILAVDRDDQTQAIKTKLLKKQIVVTEVVKVLTTYRVVTRDQYLGCDHQIAGAYGSVKIKDRGTCLWRIEPDYAAVVTLPGGEEVYLLHTEQKAQTANVKTAENADQVKGLAVTGTLKQIIGYFPTFNRPGVGDTFEIDLANLPKKMLQFTRPDDDPKTSVRPSVPFQSSLTIEKVDKRMKVQGSSLIRLSASNTDSKLVIQVRGPELEKGSKVTIYFYQESYGVIIAMAEAIGVLK